MGRLYFLSCQFFWGCHFISRTSRLLQCSVRRCIQLVARHSIHGCIKQYCKIIMDGPDPGKRTDSSQLEICMVMLQVNCWIAHARQCCAGRYGVTSMLDSNLWTHGPCRCSSRNFFYVLTRPICPSAFSSCQFRGNPPTQSVALAWISNLHKNGRLATCSKECSFVIHRQKGSDQY